VHRFWFTFSGDHHISALNLGCGVTAADRAHAERLLREVAFPIYGVRKVEAVVEDVDIRTLDEKHVRPNMGDPSREGVWWPQLT